MSKFSRVAVKEQNEGWLELLYDDAIRVALPLDVAVPADGSPPGERAAGSLQLQGSGITAMSCTEPPCVKGVPPVKQPPPPDAIRLWIDLQVEVDFTVAACGTSCLIIRGSEPEIAIPMFDKALGTEKALGLALGKFHKGLKTNGCVKGCVAYHVYLIKVAPEPLAALRDKLIALPIPGGCVAIAPVGPVDAPEPTVVAGDDKVAAAAQMSLPAQRAPGGNGIAPATRGSVDVDGLGTRR